MTATMTTRVQDPTLVDLVDALVATVDANRVHELDRLREALEPFGAAGMFNAELRLNELLGISKATAYECVRTGEIPSLRLGGRILVPRCKFEDLLSGGGDARAA